MSESERTFRLSRSGDQVLYHAADVEDGMPVRLVWTRPLTGRGGEVAVLHAKEKKEIATLPDSERLDAESRRILDEELQRRYFLPKITRVVKTTATFGNRYWHVETDRGPRQFLMKSPETNATWLTDDRCLLRDTLGNCYEIESFDRLDNVSRAQAEKVL